MMLPTWWAPVRNVLLFVTGVVILVLELEWHEHTRGWVIVLALFLMGIVTVDQVWRYVGAKATDAAEPKRWPRMPVEGLQHEQEPDTPVEPATPPTIAQERPTPPRRPEVPPEPPGLL